MINLILSGTLDDMNLENIELRLNDSTKSLKKKIFTVFEKFENVYGRIYHVPFVLEKASIIKSTETVSFVNACKFGNRALDVSFQIRLRLGTYHLNVGNFVRSEMYLHNGPLAVSRPGW